MRITGLLILWLAALTVWGQDAKVIALSEKDSAERQSLYDQQKALEQKIKDFDERVRRDYTTVPQGDKDASWHEAFPAITSIAAVSSACLISGSISFRTASSCAVDPKTGYVKCVSDSAEAKRKAEEEKQNKACEAERAKDAAERKAHPPMMWRKGWEDGVIYSEGFKYILPAEPPRSSSPVYGGMFVNPTAVSSN